MSGAPFTELQDASDPQNLSEFNEQMKWILLKLKDLEARISALESA